MTVNREGQEERYILAATKRPFKIVCSILQKKEMGRERWKAIPFEESIESRTIQEYEREKFPNMKKEETYRRGDTTVRFD